MSDSARPTSYRHLQVAAICLLLLMTACLNNQSAYAEEPLWGARFSEGFNEHFVTVPGGKICCVERPGNGPTLMLIPGTFSDSRVFRRILPHLDKSLRILLIENRGLGKSSPIPENGSIEQCGQDAVQVAKHLKVEKFYVGGHSLGGMIAIELARVIPHQLNGVISMEGWTNWYAARDAFDFQMKSTLTPQQLAESKAYRKQTLEKWTKEQEKQFAQAWRQWDGMETLKTTTLPILELYGDRNKPQATRSQLQIPNRKNIELHWIPGASHKIHIERPQLVAKLMNQFINKTEGK